MAEHFYFAWVDEDEDFDPEVHNRFDENVFAFVWDHSEGDFAGLSVTIKNPRIGLLAPGRKQWIWFAFNNGTQDDPDPLPLFKGRIIGIPTNVFDQLVTLDFRARPSDFAEQKAALAATLKELPYYDPIFVSPDSWSDPDVVLEGRSALWHIDPVTHEVTISDILVPEDGTETVTELQHLRDEMQVTLNENPLRACQVIATIPWNQLADGQVSLTRKIQDLFPNRLLQSFSFNGMLQDWPKPGAAFGSGWRVTSGNLIDVTYAAPRAIIPDIFAWQGVVPDIPEDSIVFPLKVTGEYHSGEEAGFNFQFELVVAVLGYGVPSLTVQYMADRDFGQIVSFTLRSDQQDIVTLPEDEEFLSIKINANPVSNLTEDDTLPIGDVKKRDYVHSQRGRQSIEHLLLVARAHLIARSRTVEIAFKVGFREGLRLRSLRRAVLLEDRRLPGGEAIGKIIHASASLDGDTGFASWTITMACCVGKGGSHTTDPGQPTYCEAYVEGYREFTNTTYLTDTSDIAYSIAPYETFDDGIEFRSGLNANSAVKSITVFNPEPAQRAAILAAGNGANTDQAAISEVIKNNPTQIVVQMVAMEGGPFKQEVVVSVSDLVIPKQIDLEAPSNA